MGYKVLIIEDNKVDTQLEKDILLQSDGPFEEVLLVHTKEDYKKSLQTENFDLILADYRLVDFDGIGAIQMRDQYCRYVPLIIVSGTIGEEKAVEVIKAGANDFLIKNESEKRLVQVSIRAIREAEEKMRRKGAEESLRKSEKNYRLMAENSTDLISRHAPNGEFLYVSPASYDLMGYKPEELLGTSFYNYIHPEDLKNIEKLHSSVLEAADKQYISYRIRQKDGNMLWVETTSKIFRNLKTNVIYEIQASTRDISKNKHYEELLNQAQQMARIGAWEIDLIKKMINWTPVIKEIHEVDPGFIPDMNNMMDFYKEGQHRTKIKNAVQEAIKNGKGWDLELQIVTAKGRERWIRSIGKAVYREGKCIRLYGSFQDINDHKILQENLETAQNIAKLGYWTHDLEKDQSDWSSQMFNIWEVDRATFHPSVESFLQTIHPEDKELFSGDIKKAFPGKKYTDTEHRIITPGGKVKWILQRITSHKDEVGESKLLEGIAQDITSQKIKEEEIKKALKEKEILLMEVHHRVKNNLALISSILQLQAFQSENEQVMTQLMDSEGRIHSIATIHELLYQSENFSQINLKSNIIKLAEYISDSFDGKTDVDYTLNLEDIVINVNQAIPYALIINEILTNVYKHAFEKYKHGKVEIYLSRHGEQVCIKISDNGKGLPEGFDIKKQKGLGSKLITTLADQLNAELVYDSKGSGTVFQLTFTPEDISGGGSHFLK